MLLEVFLVLFVVWVAVSRWQRRAMIRLGNQLKMDELCLPFVGHAHWFLGSGEDLMKALQRGGEKAYKAGGIISIWQGHKLYIVVNDPNIADFILKNCLEKDDVLDCIRLLTGNGSIFAPVPIWRPRRKILAPTFSPRHLTQFVAVFSRQSAALMRRLRAAGAGPFSVWKYVTAFAMDSVCESTLGVQINAQTDEDQPFLKAFEGITKLDAMRLFKPWLYNHHVFKMTPYYKRHRQYKLTLRGFINNIIKMKRRTMSAENDKTQKEKFSMKTFLELLIEGSANGFSDLELQEETLVLVMAGSDTTAVGISFAALMLAAHPDVQARAHAEILEVFGESERPVTAQDLPRLRYLDAVLRETLRLYPPVPIIVRQVCQDLPLPTKEITLVKGCGVLIHIWALHRNPRYWGEDAALFRPERFLDASVKHPAYLPFSGGPRGCLGYQYAMMSMKTALASMLRTFRLKPAVPGQHGELRVSYEVMMKSVDKFPIILEMRK